MQSEHVPRDFEVNEESIPPRRLQVLSLYVGGQSREEIAGELGLSPHTVRNHIRLVYDQLGVSNRIEALRWVLEQPDMCHKVLSQRSSGHTHKRTKNHQHPDRRPESVEDILDEAISFFQREAIENPLDG